MTTVEVTVMTSTEPIPIDSSQPLFNTELSFRIWFFVIGIGGTLMSSMGIIVNILSLGVLTTTEMRSTTSFYLTALSSNDLVYLINSLCFRCIEHMYSGFTGSDILFDNLSQRSLPYYYSVESVTLTWAVYTSVVMSVDRTICIRRPLEWKTICTQERVRKFLLIVWIVMAVLNVPLWMQFRWVIVRDELTNETHVDSEATDFSRSYFYNKVYMRYLYPLFDSVVPIVVIGACNLTIARTLNKRVEIRRTMTGELGQGKREDTYRITAMVLAISIQVLVTQSVKMIYFIVSGIHDTRMIEKCPVYCGAISACARFFSITLATTNSICFFYFGKKYRTIFLKKYGCLNAYKNLKKKTRESRDVLVRNESPGDQVVRGNHC